MLCSIILEESYFDHYIARIDNVRLLAGSCGSCAILAVSKLDQGDTDRFARQWIKLTIE
jgi:hypothetical protein